MRYLIAATALIFWVMVCIPPAGHHHSILDHTLKFIGASYD